MSNEITVTLTIESAKQLPNLLGRIVPAMLQAHGRYTAVVGQQRVTYVLAR